MSRAITPPRTRAGRALAGAVVTLVIAFTAAAASAATEAPAAGSFTAKLSAPNHTPVAGSAWHIVVTASRGKIKLNGDVNYEFVSGGQVVSHRKGHPFTGGILRDNLCFPALAVGYPLKLAVVVTTKYGSRTLYWTVTTTAGRIADPCRSAV